MNFSFDKNFCSELPQLKNLYKQTLFKGKGERASLTKSVANHLGLSKQKQDWLGKMVESIHHSSILHDDVIDASPLRRGDLSTWKQFSMKKSILAGDYLLSHISTNLADMENIYLIKLTTRVVKKLVAGEWIQNFVKDRVSQKDIEKIHELKTASLFEWCLRAPFCFVSCYETNLHNRLRRIGLLMGTLFQRADDLIDFDIRNKEKKNIFKDLREGYLNSFSVHLLQNKDKKLKMSLKTCRSLKKVKRLIGESELKNALVAFDKKSSQLIAICHRNIDQLEIQLKKKQRPMIQELKSWPNRLYWRKSV